MTPSFPVSREVSYPTEKYPTIELSDYEHLLRLGIDPRAKIKKKEEIDSKSSDFRVESELNDTKAGVKDAKVKSKEASRPDKKDSAKRDKTAVARVQKKS